MISNGRIDDLDVTEIGDIIRGRRQGRTNGDDIYLISAGGMPILDIGWGYECYRRAETNGIGTELVLWDSPYMGV